MGVSGGPYIVRDSSLVLELDAADRNSYVSGSTTWRDLTANNNNGTLTNGPTFSSSNLGSIVFDGSDDYVSITGTITLTQGTIICWIRKNGNQPNYTGILHSRSSNTTGINFNSTGINLGYHWNDAINTYSWNSNLTIPDSVWSMCAVSVSPTFAIAYLCTNTGISSSTNSVSHSSTTLNAMNIARDALSGRNFNGRVSIAQIYNLPLNANEIAQNFNAQKSRFYL